MARDTARSSKLPTGQINREARELILSFRNGQKEAFDHLFALVQPKLLTVLRYACDVDWHEDQDDLYQEVMFRFYRSQRRYDPSQDILPYLYEIARNVKRDALKRGRRRLKDEESIINRRHEAEKSNIREALNGGRTDLEMAFKIALQKISEDDRDLLFRRFFFGYSVKELSEQLKVPVPKVKYCLRRASNKLCALFRRKNPPGGPPPASSSSRGSRTTKSPRRPSVSYRIALTDVSMNSFFASILMKLVMTMNCNALLKKLFQGLEEEVSSERQERAVSRFRFAVGQTGAASAPASPPKARAATARVRSSLMRDESRSKVLTCVGVVGCLSRLYIRLAKPLTIASAAGSVASTIGVLTIVGVIHPSGVAEPMQESVAAVEIATGAEEVFAKELPVQAEGMPSETREHPGPPTSENERKSSDLYHLGQTLAFLGSYEAALENYRKAADILEKQFGRQRYGLDPIYASIGDVFFKLGNLEEARRNIEHALEISKVTDGENSREYAAFLDALAGVYLAEGKIREAATLGEQEFAIREGLEQHDGTIEPRVTIIAYNLARSFQSLRDESNADKYFGVCLRRIPRTPDYPGFSALRVELQEKLAHSEPDFSTRTFNNVAFLSQR